MSRKFINFLKSPSGKCSLFTLFFVILYFIFTTDNKASTKGPNIQIPDERNKEQYVGNIIEFDGASMTKEVDVKEIKELAKPDVVEVKTPPKKVKPVAKKVTQIQVRQPKPVEVVKLPVIRTISLYSNSKSNDKYTSNLYAPYGRLIKCELVNTVDTSNLTSPIIAIVAEDVTHDGKVIIPANTEIHGLAAKSAVRDRVGTNTNWTFVWRTLDKDNGKEMKVKATALASTKSPDGDYWAIDDGSAGIPGLVIDNRSEELLKALAAIAVKGIGEGLKDETTTSVGGDAIATGYEDTANAILGNMLEEGGDFVAKQILDSIEKQGYYVRCGAGTSFYLYVMQTIDMKEAAIGNAKK